MGAWPHTPATCWWSPGSSRALWGVIVPPVQLPSPPPGAAPTHSPPVRVPPHPRASRGGHDPPRASSSTAAAVLGGRSLTGAPAGRCPGAAAPGRAGGWGSAAPPAATQRGDGDVLWLPRHRSCRRTEPRGARVALTGTGSSQLRRRHTTRAPSSRARHQVTRGLLGRDLHDFGDAKDHERYCWHHLLSSKARGALKISAPGNLPFACEKGDVKADRQPGTDGPVQAGEVEPRCSSSINPTTCSGRRSLRDPYSLGILPKKK